MTVMQDRRHVGEKFLAIDGRQKDVLPAEDVWGGTKEGHGYGNENKQI